MRSNFLLFILASCLLASCNKLLEKPKWDVDMKAPLVTTSLSIANIVKDTSMVKTNPDNSVKIVSREELYDLNVDSLVKIEVTPYTKNVKLATLQLSSQSITRPISLGELATQMKNNGDPLGDFIINNNGQWTVVPPISNLTAGPLDVNIQQFFENATLLTGTMTITLTNNLPVNITNTQFELKNKIGGEIITNQTYSNLNTGTSQSQTEDLAGKTIEGILSVNVLDMDLGGGFVQIDTSDALVITIKVENVTVSEATAVFPAQDVVNEKTETSLIGMDDVRLRKTKLDLGTIEAKVNSTAEDTVYFTYKIPSAKRNGVEFVMNAKINPAPPNGSVDTTFSANFDGYELDLTGKAGHDTVNTFYSELTGHIEYTGKKVNLSLQDSFTVVVNLINAEPSYVTGYFGRDTIDVASGSFDLTVFDNIKSGTLNFEDVKVNLIVENGLGLDGQFEVTNLQALNTKTGQSAGLTTTLSGNIDAATDNPLTSKTSVVQLSDPQLTNMINILPNKLLYNARMIYNAANDGLYTDFAYKGSALKPYLEIELPLSIIANDLVLTDTVSFLSDKFQTSVNSGTFSVLIENGFPVGGDLRMYFMDEGNSVIDSVISSAGVLPAEVDNTNKVSSKKSSKVSFVVDANRMKNILRSRSVIFEVKFSTTTATTPPNSFVKIYSDYTIDFKLVGDFNYTIQ